MIAIWSPLRSSNGSAARAALAIKTIASAIRPQSGFCSKENFCSVQRWDFMGGRVLEVRESKNTKGSNEVGRKGKGNYKLFSVRYPTSSKRSKFTAFDRIPSKSE